MKGKESVMTEGEWLYLSETKKKSWAEGDNLLWRRNNIYIMDNHRLAMWAWNHHVQSTSKLGVLHVDRHCDMQTFTAEDQTVLDDNPIESLSEYRNIETTIRGIKRPVKLLRWDNYINAFASLHNDKINSAVYVVHPEHEYEASEIGGTEITKYQVETILYGLRAEFERESSWIVNLDLDVLFCSGPGSDEKHIQFLSQDWICSFLNEILTLMRNKKCLVLTIALSPDCCGGWKKSEQMINIVSDFMNLGFRLPKYFMD